MEAYPDINALLYHLRMHYQIAARDIERLGGYSNGIWKVTGKKAKNFIVRVSSEKRDARQVFREEYVLEQLAMKGYGMAPRIVPTAEGEGHSMLRRKEATSFVHVFDYIPGETRYKWYDRCSTEELQEVFRGLSRLHALLKEIPAGTANDVQLIFTKPGPGLFILPADDFPEAAFLNENKVRYLEQAERILEQATRIPLSPPQWIHGDIHLENIISGKRMVEAFIDFENVRYSPVETDLIFSALRICKTGRADDRLGYESDDLKLAFRSYADHSTMSLFDWKRFESEEHFWRAFFCLDQSLMYLKNASEGRWQLAPGIGFFPCFNEVLNYEE